MPGPNKIHQFWLRLSAGLTVQELWNQFKREAQTSMAVYSSAPGPRNADTSQPHRGMEFLRTVRAVVRAMLEKLSPARRVLLFVAIIFLVLPQVKYHPEGSTEVSLQFPGATFAALVILLLLILELADRVAMKRDLEIARDIQKLLLPSEPPACDGIDIAFTSRPANTVAGDYYDALYRNTPDGSQRLLLLIADVAGKGIPAGMLMATLQASVRTIVDEPASLPQMVARLNRSTCSRSSGGQRFITAFFAELDPRTHVLTYVNAGHDPPILVRSNGVIETLNEGGLVLGFLPDAPYGSGQTTLEKGDVLHMYTDGVVESVNGFGAEYGPERLQAFLQTERETSAAARLKHLIASVDSFTAGAAQYDDITCLILSVTAEAAHRPEFAATSASHA